MRPLRRASLTVVLIAALGAVAGCTATERGATAPTHVVTPSPANSATSNLAEPAEQPSEEPATESITWQQTCIFSAAEINTAFAGTTFRAGDLGMNAGDSDGPGCEWRPANPDDDYVTAPFSLDAIRRGYGEEHYGVIVSGESTGSFFDAPDRATAFASACDAAKNQATALSGKVTPTCTAGASGDIVVIPHDTTAWVFQDSGIWYFFPSGGYADDAAMSTALLKIATLAANRTP